MKKVVRFGLKNITEKCVITRQENYQKVERQLSQKPEIKNRLRFEKVDRKVNSNLENFSQKNSRLLIEKGTTLFFNYVEKSLCIMARKTNTNLKVNECAFHDSFFVFSISNIAKTLTGIALIL